MAFTTSLDTSWKAIWVVRFQQLKSYLYWYNTVVATIYVFFFVLASEIGLGGYKLEYDNSTNRTGFLIHALSGSVFYISGYLQFNSNLRRHYPGFHRVVGYVYLFMSLFLFGAIIIVLIGGALVADNDYAWTPTLFVYWCYCNYDSMISIYRKDVERHRRMNLRAFSAANCIIYMRAFLYIGLALGRPFVPTLVLAFWTITLWAIASCEIFLFLENYLKADPIFYLSDGRKFYGTVRTGNSPFTEAVPIIVDECEMLDDTSLRMVFHTADEAMAFFFPGQHISFTLPSNSYPPLCREYSPIVTEEYAMVGRIQVWIRLHPKGAMSGVLRDYASTFNNKFPHDSEIQVVNPMKLEGFGVSMKMPSSSDEVNTSMRFSARKMVSCPLLLSVSSSRLTYFPSKYKELILVATGTGLAPFINLIKYVINNKDDTTTISLVYITNGDKFGVNSLNAIDGKGRLSVDVRKTKPRFGIAQIEEMIDSKFGGKSSISGVRDPFSFQIHIGGSLSFIKGLDKDIRNSRAIRLEHRDQLVSWGFSDR